MIYVSQIIMLPYSNLYSAAGQLYLNKTVILKKKWRRKKEETKPKKEKEIRAKAKDLASQNLRNNNPFGMVCNDWLTHVHLLLYFILLLVFFLLKWYYKPSKIPQFTQITKLLWITCIYQWLLPISLPNISHVLF